MNRWTVALLLLPLGAGCGAEVSNTRAGAEPGPPAEDVRASPGLAAVAGARSFVGADGSDGIRRGGDPSGAPDRASALPPAVRIPDDPPRFRRPQDLRGIYLNAWTAGSSRRIEQLVALARETEVNAFVIDLKDASGYVSHSTAVETARSAGATRELRINDLPGLLRRLEREGIYPIARIVIVQDPVLATAHPELAVQDREGGVWVDGKGIRWLNPHSREVWDYHVELAREAARLGFPEIQWDYVRFPDAPKGELARALYPGAEGVGHSQAIRGFLAYARERLADLDVAVTADVFGVTTSAKDVGIGQVWEEFIDVVDAALPMIYPSHYYRGSFGIELPNAHPYEIVKHALEHALRRTRGVESAGAVVPWLQDFSLGQPPYGAAEVRAQIQAAYDVGIHEWILWNPSSRYTREALEPAGGFHEEPSIRVAGRVVPVSGRHAALTAPREAVDDPVPTPVGEPAPAPPPSDTLPASVGDTLPASVRDTVRTPAGDAPRRSTADTVPVPRR